jgi:hypothetical protein
MTDLKGGTTRTPMEDVNTFEYANRYPIPWEDDAKEQTRWPTSNLCKHLLSAAPWQNKKQLTMTTAGCDIWKD